MKPVIAVVEAAPVCIRSSSVFLSITTFPTCTMNNRNSTFILTTVHYKTLLCVQEIFMIIIIVV